MGSGSSDAAAVVWVIAVVVIQSLARELPCSPGAALGKRKGKKKKEISCGCVVQYFLKRKKLWVSPLGTVHNLGNMAHCCM